MATQPNFSDVTGPSWKPKPQLESSGRHLSIEGDTGADLPKQHVKYGERRTASGLRMRSLKGMSIDSVKEYVLENKKIVGAIAGGILLLIIIIAAATAGSSEDATTTTSDAVLTSVMAPLLSGQPGAQLFQLPLDSSNSGVSGGAVATLLNESVGLDNEMFTLTDATEVPDINDILEIVAPYSIKGVPMESSDKSSSKWRLNQIVDIAGLGGLALIEGESIQDIADVDIDVCAQKCKNEPRCKSFTFCSTALTCSLKTNPLNYTSDVAPTGTTGTCQSYFEALEAGLPRSFRTRYAMRAVRGRLDIFGATFNAVVVVLLDRTSVSRDDVGFLLKIDIDEDFSPQLLNPFSAAVEKGRTSAGPSWLSGLRLPKSSSIVLSTASLTDLSDYRLVAGVNIAPAITPGELESMLGSLLDDRITDMLKLDGVDFVIRIPNDHHALADGEDIIDELPDASIALDGFEGMGMEVYDGRIKITDFDSDPKIDIYLGARVEFGEAGHVSVTGGGEFKKGSSFTLKGRVAESDFGPMNQMFELKALAVKIVIAEDFMRVEEVKLDGQGVFVAGGERITTTSTAHLLQDSILLEVDGLPSASVLGKLNSYACDLAKICSSDAARFIDTLNLVGARGLNVRAVLGVYSNEEGDVLEPGLFVQARGNTTDLVDFSASDFDLSPVTDILDITKSQSFTGVRFPFDYTLRDFQGVMSFDNVNFRHADVRRLLHWKRLGVALSPLPIPAVELSGLLEINVNGEKLIFFIKGTATVLGSMVFEGSKVRPWKNAFGIKGLELTNVGALVGVHPLLGISDTGITAAITIDQMTYTMTSLYSPSKFQFAYIKKLENMNLVSLIQFLSEMNGIPYVFDFLAADNKVMEVARSLQLNKVEITLSPFGGEIGSVNIDQGLHIIFDVEFAGATLKCKFGIMEIPGRSFTIGGLVVLPVMDLLMDFSLIKFGLSFDLAQDVIDKAIAYVESKTEVCVPHPYLSGGGFGGSILSPKWDLPDIKYRDVCVNLASDLSPVTDALRVLNLRGGVKAHKLSAKGHLLQSLLGNEDLVFHADVEAFGHRFTGTANIDIGILTSDDVADITDKVVDGVKDAVVGKVDTVKKFAVGTVCSVLGKVCGGGMSPECADFGPLGSICTPRVGGVCLDSLYSEC